MKYIFALPLVLILIVSLVTFRRNRRDPRRNCEHVWREFAPIAGEWSGNQPHPHPLFADKLKVQLQPIAQAKVCFKCSASALQFGHNQRDAEPELPLTEKE